MFSEELTQAVVDQIGRLIREEVAEAIEKRHNWKVTVNGSAGGDVRAVVEHYSDVVKNGVLVVRD